jgi:uroporphyrinogen-III synthase
MRLLITRPLHDAVTLAEKLRALGHEPVIAPIMDVQFREGPPLVLEGVQAILATSANGVRALTKRTERRDLPLFAVGPQTSELAQAEGFQDVRNANGDADALAAAVAGWADPAKGPLFHAAGAETTGRLRQGLMAQGLKVETGNLYEAKSVESLPVVAADALRQNLLDGAMLFSPRTAKIFAQLVMAESLNDACARLEAFCISAATAAGLSPLSFARVAVAGDPNLDALLKLLPQNTKDDQNQRSVQ